MEKKDKLSMIFAGTTVVYRRGGDLEEGRCAGFRRNPATGDHRIHIRRSWHLEDDLLIDLDEVIGVRRRDGSLLEF